jgi:cold shock CspA family protein
MVFVQRAVVARTPHPALKAEMQGEIVALINRARRYGFIRSDKGFQLFFHSSALQPKHAYVTEGQRVEFTCETDPASGKLKATIVKLLDHSPALAP